ncbi:tyrosine-type recombinase/integrase [Hirschia baltica]|uniref:Integrase family protein n=1 Tax=Hirschia baltica (strain ATCC 49814 / DSM 5838 / IFAM 1418) TaxID=582402 RepID=C6XPD2_HIRBI|nr:site-specific integrase [Hirschia baltica]ACT58418.1 integrase family protein [Hirschia baltica ATCC 49814]
MKLTKRSVDLLVSEDRDKDYYDDALKSFGVRIRKSGRKSYFVMSRYKGRMRRITIGQHGPLTAEDARKQAKSILHDLSSGIDPTEDKTKIRQSGTVKKLCERFMIEYVPQHLKPSTASEYKRSIEIFILPKLGRLIVKDVSRQDIIALHHDMRGTPYQANRTLGVLSILFSQAEVWGLRDEFTNPCRGIKKFREEKRERFLSLEELQRLGRALHEETALAPSAVACIKLLILTGCRLGEIQKLKWVHVDLDRQLLLLPDSKTGKKTIYLGTSAVDLLKSTPRQLDNPFVIAGYKQGQYLTDLQKPWRRIRKAANLEDVRIHDLRHTYASTAVANGESLPMIGKLLGHSQPQTTARYAHLADIQAVEVADKISIHLSEALLK